MRRRLTVLVAMAMLLAMMLTVAAPAMAAQGVCPPGSRAQPLIVFPGPGAIVLFDCVTPGQPGQPPLVIR